MYCAFPAPGKSVMVPTVELKTPRDLAMVQGAGVAEPCKGIEKKPDLAYKYTNKGRTIACISNGTSVLGLGNIGAAASKPDIEGKSVMFKQFADIDSVDLCVDIQESNGFINVVKFLSPSFGAINLEHIRAPDCFLIEQELKKNMKIPVFHNDQHGTAVVVLAGLMNALEIKGKNLADVKIVVNGAGPSGIASL